MRETDGRLFYQFKPVTSLAGPTDPIPVPQIAQEAPGVDYECELVVVIGRQCRDVPEAEALDYVLGYAVGNDVSQREWQIARSGGQWSIGKGFDDWAPFGPGLVSPAVIPDPQKLQISTRLNGEVVQVSQSAEYHPTSSRRAKCGVGVGGHNVDDETTGEQHCRSDLQRSADDCLPEPWYHAASG